MSLSPSGSCGGSCTLGELEGSQLGHATYVFIAGWHEEQFVAEITFHIVPWEVAIVPQKSLFESLRGDAMFLPTPAADGESVVSAQAGQGILVSLSAAELTPSAFLHTFAQDSRDRVTMVQIQRADGEIVDAVAFTRTFPGTQVPGTIIPDGQWLGRPLPSPLISVSLKELSEVRHIFAYGTLRSDDTSGASWTKPFNEDMMSEHALVRGASLYLQSFPIVLIPPHHEHPNEGVVGCVVSAKDPQTFHHKLREADRIESTPSLYRRGVVRAETKSGNVVHAFIYYRSLQQVGGDSARFLKTRIASGNFLRRGAAFEF